MAMTRKNRKDPAAVKLGKRGGKARARNLTPKELSAIGRMGGEAGGRGRKKT